MSVFEGKTDDTLQEVIPESLKYQGALKSSIVLNKSSVRLFPVGNQTVDSASNKQVLFRIASSEYLLPSTACLNFRCRVGHKNIYGQELVALSLLDSLTISVGGIEVEYIVEISELTKLLIHHSVPANTYEKTYKTMLGAWKYCPRETTYVATDDTNRTVAAGSTGLINHQGGIDATADKTAVPIAGRLVTEDSFPMADGNNDLFVGDGREYSIPLHLLSGIFRLKNLLPVWAMGSIDIKIDFAKFEKFALISQSLDRTAKGGLTVERTIPPNDTAAGPANAPDATSWADQDIRLITDPNLKKYTIDHINITADFVQCDSGYNTLLASLISTSSVVLPFETYATVQRSFPAGQSINQLLISRGLSYLKQTHMIMRPQAIVENPYYDHSGGRYGDIFKSIQYEIGSKLYHPQKIDTKVAMWRERDIAFEQMGSTQAGGVVPYDAFIGHRNKFNGETRTPWVGTEAQYDKARTSEMLQPNLEMKQDFVMSMNYEKVLGEAQLSGVNSRLSGYNLHITMESLPASTTNPTGTLTAANAFEYPSAYFNAAADNIQLLCFMHHDRSLIMARDTVQVSE